MMYSSHAVLWLDFVLLVILSFISSGILFLNAVQINYKEHTSITLYQGTDKFHLDARDCPVGVAFIQAERFSCACINGIWAFYGNPCHEPIAIVGGYGHCFTMPKQPIRLVVAVSNPLRALGESLTVFENNMDGIQSKIYRSMRIALSGADKLISLNSSWTLTSPDGTKSVCLENKMVEKTATKEAAGFSNLTYCSYSNLAEEMPFIGAVKKGCNSSMVLEPVQCQSMLPNNEADICMAKQTLREFQEAPVLEADVETELYYEHVTNVRPSRSLKNLGTFQQDKSNRENVEEEPLEATKEYASAYQGEPEWRRRWRALIGPLINSTQTSSPSNQRQYKTPIDLGNAWENPQSFLFPPPSKSNSLVTNHLWMFRRVELRTVLNISRLTPPEDDLPVQIESGKIKKLFGVHKDVIKKICPLVPPSFFDTIVGTFLSLLVKAFRWNEPYLGQIPYLRILTSLSLCRKKAAMMKFKQSASCRDQNTQHIYLPSLLGNDTVLVQLDIPKTFRSGNHEPIIEAAWKIFVTVHSYCFKDFRGQYQDHHTYTMLMMGMFSNQLHDIWVRNQTLGIEYAGLLGDIQETMGGLERCVAGARMTSEYPFHLNRPAMLSKYQEENFETGSHIRKKRSLSGKRVLNEEWIDRVVTAKLAENKPGSIVRKKRLTVNSIISEHKIGNTVFNGRGVCLKKYNDHKTTVGIHCKEAV